MRSTLVGKVLDLKVESVKKILVDFMLGEQALDSNGVSLNVGLCTYHLRTNATTFRTLIF